MLEAAADQAELAVTDDDGSSEFLGPAGCALSGIGQQERGMEILERAVAIDQSNAQAHAARGATLAFLGERDAGIAASPA